jgi:hypothetical protein
MVAGHPAYLKACAAGADAGPQDETGQRLSRAARANGLIMLPAGAYGALLPPLTLSEGGAREHRIAEQDGFPDGSAEGGSPMNAP